MLPILHQSIWRDEAFSLLLSLKHPLEIILLTAKDVSPPLYYIILHYWLLVFGNDEVVARSLSLLFHIGTAVFLYLLSGNKIKSRLARFAITFCTLFNPFLLQYAFEIRAYSLLAFLSIVSCYFLLKKNYLVTGIFLAIAILTHNFAIPNGVAIFIWYLYTKKKLVSFKELSSLFLFPTIALLLWGSVLWMQWTKVSQGFWIQLKSSSIFIYALQKFTTGDLKYPTSDLLFFLSLLLLSFVVCFFLLKKDEEKEESLILLLIGVPVILTYLVTALYVPIFHERYLISVAPFLIYITGYSIYSLYQTLQNVRWFLLIVVGMYIVVLLQSAEYILYTSTKPAINYAVSQILRASQSEDIIVSKSVLNFLETKYYVKKSGKHIQVFAYSPTGKIPFYIGNILFEKSEILTTYPTNKRIWLVHPDGGFSQKIN